MAKPRNRVPSLSPAEKRGRMGLPPALLLAGLLLATIVPLLPAADSAAAKPARATVAALPAATVLIKDVPHVRQRPDFCGEACVEMILRKLGRKDYTQDTVFAVSGLDPALGRGCYTRDLKAALEAIGFKPGPVSYALDSTTASQSLDTQFRALVADLEAGLASIVCMHSGDTPKATEHFRLILGYDPVADEVIYHEPAEDNAPYRRMARPLFLKLWPLRVSQRRQFAIRFRLEPGALVPAPAAPPGHSAADVAQRAMEVNPLLPPGFTMIQERPFLVVSDLPQEELRALAKRPIRWAVQKLREDYFAKDPAAIIVVWLFKDKASYEENTRAVFNERPHTPFGYYSSEHQALIMNISTGGGTLVHEIVHPYMRANFPACPDWFNEGLASLYEQCAEKDGHIVGNTNWRLRGLQEAIRGGKLPSFEELLGTRHGTFYSEDPGSNYAQARYLCYYLQQKGRLHDYYRAFTAAAAKDPTGIETLRASLGTQDLAAFKKEWEAFVLKLKFP